MKQKLHIITLALLMGFAQQIIHSMEQPTKTLHITTHTQAEPLRIALREMIINMPERNWVTWAEFAGKLGDISALIQATHMNPGTEIVGLIRDRKLGDALYEIAQRNRNNATMIWLAQNQLISNPQDRFFEAFYRNNLRLAEILLQNGADIHAHPPMSKFPLLAQVAFGINHNGKPLGKYSLEQFKFLLEHGADVNQIDIYDLTPMDHALDARAWDKVRLLLDYGGKPSALLK